MNDNEKHVLIVMCIVLALMAFTSCQVLVAQAESCERASAEAGEVSDAHR